MKAISLSIIGVFLSFLSCSSGVPEGTPMTFGKGKYSFTMYDSTGKKTIMKGVMTVITYEDDQITGTLEYNDIRDKDFVPLSSMSNEFSGNVVKKDNVVFINTNPRLADSNVFWNLKIGRSSLNGEWTHSVFRGQGQRGIIKIKPKK